MPGNQSFHFQVVSTLLTTQRTPWHWPHCALAGTVPIADIWCFSACPHTLDIDRVSVRLLGLAHERRNLAEYEGYMDVDEALLRDLLLCAELLQHSLVRRVPELLKV